ncbi:hypothetical protein SAMN02745978_00497 [Butyricicoccus pullicaecorum DSM 23266]|uniref:Fibronectin type-III domain-containing protein n=1 Tax=Butyricicoccus pullicaecorum 1.2 TaxID=1203606 RepID=R8W1A3_9FIRM|nr:DUF6273 domain-containing protein [Butyricicoccus pullicaecorum]EOQ38326.1 hypothetical protein HMPREF1526_01356 [Butyricicoccus pullicaecorum 1.2]SKA54224.1 hypothetical protein SAMN02745978_00497 [Butyricicoccus pullicaecorum DSM 23266]
MATRKLGDVAVGEIVKLKENGIAINYIVVHQGKPSSIYDNSCDGTWLLRQNIVEKHVWSDDNYNILEDSAIHLWLSRNILGRYDTRIQAAIKQVKIPYIANGGNGGGQNGANGLSCKIFLLSGQEVGFSSSHPHFPEDGAKLNYFDLGTGTTANNKRIASLNDEPLEWWLRSPYAGDRYAVWCVYHNGNYSNMDSSNSTGIRPALILPATLYAIDDGTITTNASPNSPATITIPETIHGGADAKISWPASTDPDGNLDGYIVERSYNGGSSWAQIYQGRSTSTTTTIPFGTETVMFRVCAYDTYGEKSGWRTSANKTVVNNRAPAAPPSISVPLSPAGGDKLTITWTASTDVDGNLEGYELERQWDDAGAFTQIYKGAGLSYQDSIPKGEHTSVAYRVRAYDSFAAYSSYTTSPSRTIDNNTAPVIACDLSGDLGEKSEGFSIQYTIKDAEKQEVTVVERVGDLVKRTYKPTLDQQNTFEVTGEYFQRILNGQQTVQIVATDSAGKSSTLELTFTKKVHKAVITLSEPLAVEEQITVAVLAITGKIPADATQLVELTNNGNDAEPVWEDATADVKAGRNHPFTNKTQTNGWAFNFRVTVERGESGEDGNIVSIQGGFQ